MNRTNKSPIEIARSNPIRKWWDRSSAFCLGFLSRCSGACEQLSSLVLSAVPARRYFHRPSKPTNNRYRVSSRMINGSLLKLESFRRGCCICKPRDRRSRASHRFRHRLSHRFPFTLLSFSLSFFLSLSLSLFPSFFLFLFLCSSCFVICVRHNTADGFLEFLSCLAISVLTSHSCDFARFLSLSSISLLSSFNLILIDRATEKSLLC